MLDKYFESAQFAVCGATAIILLSIWKTGFPVSPSQVKKDPGVGWLSAACALWSFMGLLQLLPRNLITQANRTEFSVVNSFFLLGAVVRLEIYLEKPPKLLAQALAHLRTGAFWGWLGGGIVVSVLLAAPGRGWASLLDVALSTFTISLLAYGLFKSFQDREFIALPYLAVIVLLLQLVGQVPELSSFISVPPELAGDNQTWILLTSKTMVCMLFIALTYTWSHRQATIAGKAAKPRLRILAPRSSEKVVGTEKKRKTVTAFEVEATRLVYEPVTVSLRPGLFLRVLEVALARIKGQDEGWKRAKAWHGAARDAGDNVKNEFSDILGATRVDLIFDTDQSRGRRVAAEPEDIEIDAAGILKDANVFDAEHWKAVKDDLESLLPSAKAAARGEVGGSLGTVEPT